MNKNRTLKGNMKKAPTKAQQRNSFISKEMDSIHYMEAAKSGMEVIRRWVNGYAKNNPEAATVPIDDIQDFIAKCEKDLNEEINKSPLYAAVNKEEARKQNAGEKEKQ